MERKNAVDPESGRQAISHWKLITDQGVVTEEIINWDYEGAGTKEDPYVVEWIEHDPRNPLTWRSTRKWTFAICMAVATLTVSFCSSAFSSGIEQIIEDFHSSSEVAVLGVSLFVLGFALGPLLWAPFSEIYGRQLVFFITFFAFSAFNAGAAGSQNMTTLLILRFFGGAFGSSPLTNAGGVVSDLFAARERGPAMSFFSLAPFMGPVFGPIVGGFVSMKEGWRWLEGLMAIFSGVMFIGASLCTPETYAPVILRQRARTLSKMTGKVYMSRIDIDQGQTSIGEALLTSLGRPWVLLLTEPIVLLLSLYMAIIYGTLYMMFGAYPIVYEAGRGWNQGVGGLPFIGVAIGQVSAVTYNIVYDNKRYLKCVDSSEGGFASPEARLPPCILGGCCLPIGLFWFAWTNYPSFPWAASVAAGIPFGFGMVLIFLGVINYLIDAYTIFAASVLAGNGVIRSIFGAAFPLFTHKMYGGLGIHWASSIPGFLAIACLPFPFLFYKYGATIRKKCKYAAQSEAFMAKMRSRAAAATATAAAAAAAAAANDANSSRTPAGHVEETADQQAMDQDYTYEDEIKADPEAETGPRFQEMQIKRQGEDDDEEKKHAAELSKVRTGRSTRSRRSNRTSKEE